MPHAIGLDTMFVASKRPPSPTSMMATSTFSSMKVLKATETICLSAVQIRNRVSELCLGKALRLLLLLAMNCSWIQCFARTRDEEAHQEGWGTGNKLACLHSLSLSSWKCGRTPKNTWWTGPSQLASYKPDARLESFMSPSAGARSVTMTWEYLAMWRHDCKYACQEHTDHSALHV